ncbi:MAG: hypothetical protein ACON42_02010 [Flavobacteriaceae bacterium]
MKTNKILAVSILTLLLYSCQDSSKKAPFSTMGSMEELAGQWELTEFTYPNVEQRYKVGDTGGNVHYKTVTFDSNERFNTYTDSHIVYGSKYIYVINKDTIKVKSGYVDKGVSLDLKQFIYGFNETKDQLKLQNLATGVTEYFKKKP